MLRNHLLKLHPSRLRVLLLRLPARLYRGTWPVVGYALHKLMSQWHNVIYLRQSTSHISQKLEGDRRLHLLQSRQLGSNFFSRFICPDAPSRFVRCTHPFPSVNTHCPYIWMFSSCRCTTCLPFLSVLPARHAWIPAPYYQQVLESVTRLVPELCLPMDMKHELSLLDGQRDRAT